jgi:hypothetical protein
MERPTRLAPADSGLAACAPTSRALLACLLTVLLLQVITGAPAAAQGADAAPTVHLDLSRSSKTSVSARIVNSPSRANELSLSIEIYPEGLGVGKPATAQLDPVTLEPGESRRIKLSTARLQEGDVRTIPFVLVLRSGGTVRDEFSYVPEPDLHLNKPIIVDAGRGVSVMVRNRGFAGATNCSLTLRVLKIDRRRVGSNDHVAQAKVDSFPPAGRRTVSVAAPESLPGSKTLKDTECRLELVCKGLPRQARNCP